MPFVKVLTYYVNLDHIIYVHDTGEYLSVAFKDSNDKPLALSVKKGEKDSERLLQVIERHMA